MENVMKVKGNVPNKVIIVKGDMNANSVGIQGPRGPKGEKGDRGLPAFFHFFIEDKCLFIDQTTDEYTMMIDENGDLLVMW